MVIVWIIGWSQDTPFKTPKPESERLFKVGFKGLL